MAEGLDVDRKEAEGMEIFVPPVVSVENGLQDGQVFMWERTSTSLMSTTRGWWLSGWMKSALEKGPLHKVRRPVCMYSIFPADKTSGNQRLTSLIPCVL